MLNKKYILSVSLLFLFTISYSFAQNNMSENEINSRKFDGRFSRGRARLKGIVKNEAGALIENALVVLTHEDGVSKFVQKTNKKGEWAFIGLGTGKFAITINLKGYKPFKIFKKVSQLRRNPILRCVIEKREESNKNEFRIDFKQLSHKINSSIRINEKIYVLFNYKVPEDYEGGVYIWVVPVAARSISKFRANFISRDIESSALITKKHGTLTRYFSIKNGNKMVKTINILMMDKERDKILAKYSIRVNYFTQPKVEPNKAGPYGRQTKF